MTRLPPPLPCTLIALLGLVASPLAEAGEGQEGEELLQTPDSPEPCAPDPLDPLGEVCYAFAYFYDGEELASSRSTAAAAKSREVTASAFVKMTKRSTGCQVTEWGTSVGMTRGDKTYSYQHGLYGPGWASVVNAGTGVPGPYSEEMVGGPLTLAKGEVVRVKARIARDGGGATADTGFKSLTC